MSRHILQTRLAAVALLSVGLIAPTVVSAQDFEGVITMRMPGMQRQGAPPESVEYWSRAGNVRMNMSSPAGSLVILGLAGEQKVYVIVESQKSYMEVTPSDAAAAAPTAATVARTGRKELIAGTECEHVIVEATGANGVTKTDICLTRALGPFVNPMTTVAGARLSPWQRQLIADGGFPLKVTLNDGSVALEVTKIERKRVSDALFRIPTDFNKMALPRRP